MAPYKTPDFLPSTTTDSKHGQDAFDGFDGFDGFGRTSHGIQVGRGGVGCIHEIDGEFEGRSSYEYADGGGVWGGEGSSPPPPRKILPSFSYIHISIYPNIHIPISISIHINPFLLKIHQILLESIQNSYISLVWGLSLGHTFLALLW